MTSVRLVRHAEPSESIGVDPGLTPLGLEQAASLVECLHPCALVTSPLRRARATAEPLARAWGLDAVVEPAVRELPSPTTTVAERRAWLRSAMRSTFSALGPQQRAWRDDVLALVGDCNTETVIVTHALVINAVIGVCTGDDRVLHMHPAHASITTVDVAPGGRIELVERGAEAATRLA